MGGVTGKKKDERLPPQSFTLLGGVRGSPGEKIGLSRARGGYYMNFQSVLTSSFHKKGGKM